MHTNAVTGYCAIAETVIATTIDIYTTITITATGYCAVAEIIVAASVEIYTTVTITATGYRNGAAPTFSTYYATEDNNLQFVLTELDDGAAQHFSRDAYTTSSSGVYIKKAQVGYIEGDTVGISFRMKGNITTDSAWRSFTVENVTLTTTPTDRTLSADAWRDFVFAGTSTSAEGALIFYVSASNDTKEFYLRNLYFAKADVTGLSWVEAPEDIVG